MLACFVFQRDKGAPACKYAEVQHVIDLAFAAGDFEAKEGQTLLFYGDEQTGLAAKRILVVGLGKQDVKDGTGWERRELLRKGGGTVAATALKTRAGKILAIVPVVAGLAPEATVESLTEGLLLGAYQFRKYKSGPEPGNGDPKPGHIERIVLYDGAGSSAVARGLKRGKIAALAVRQARDMANEPGNVWTPDAFADYGRELASRYNLFCKVLTKTEMMEQGMGGILGVSSGSAQSPAMVIVEYRTAKNAPTLLLVGKGLTFDSGGISLKPGNGMEEMKYDMCGGAAVLAAMQVVGEEKPPHINVVVVVPASENLPGPAALKPGDIITMYGGKTVEVVNTDAEGRLILADALAYGVATYKPDAVIDLATLTGAVVVALGHHRTGLLANDEKLAAKVLASGEQSGELLWRLPLAPEYAKQIHSEVADLKNVGNRAAGTITAAAFLQAFVGETPWAHMDIAGTAWDYTEKSYVPKGPSGIGVRTLVDLIRHWR
jgi:leucyl aminopeptidase